MEAFPTIGQRAVDAATATATEIDPSRTTARVAPVCIDLSLPSGGVITLENGTTFTLAQDALFQPSCTPGYTSPPSSNSSYIIGAREFPFHASTIPQVFVLGSMLFLAWVLVVILIITPRTYFIVGSPSGGILGRRGMMGGTTGTSSVIGVGGRPWLQKAATLGVGISLLIATINSFKVTMDQYQKGVEDAEELTKKVVGSTELQIIRTISFTFLWLAQVQTLIRLFPRHKEKVIIKWIGFALIFLDTLFAILNSFVADHPITRIPQSFDNAIAALAYIFQLVLNFVYLCAVLAYSWAKRRFAYYHPKMRNVSVVAFISVCSIFVPLVFFVLDVVVPVYIGWGDYVRWVGAAAASVVVWEWVERVEALEREERKDGILGREVFDGDEVPYSSSTVELSWPKRRLVPRKPSNQSSRGSGSGGGSSGIGGEDHRGGGDPGEDGRGTRSTVRTWFSSSTTLLPSSLVTSITDMFPFLRQTRSNDGDLFEKNPADTSRGVRTQAPTQNAIQAGMLSQDSEPQPIHAPPTVASPVSRADTTSAASTVYAVVHHPPGHSDTPPVPLRQSPPDNSPQVPVQSSQGPHPHTSTFDFSPIRNSTNPPVTQHKQITPPSPTSHPDPDGPQGISYNPFSRSAIRNPFKRQRTAPPPEVTAAMMDANNTFTPERKRKRDRFRFGTSNYVETQDLPTFDIPAREDGAAWSPQDNYGRTDWTEPDKEVESGPSPNNPPSPNDSPSTSQESNERQSNGLTQMPSIDGALNTTARRSPHNQNVTGSTPSPRPGPTGSNSGGAERLPTLQESGLSGASRYARQ